MNIDKLFPPVQHSPEKETEEKRLAVRQQAFDSAEQSMKAFVAAKPQLVNDTESKTYRQTPFVETRGAEFALRENWRVENFLVTTKKSTMGYALVVKLPDGQEVPYATVSVGKYIPIEAHGADRLAAGIEENLAVDEEIAGLFEEVGHKLLEL